MAQVQNMREQIEGILTDVVALQGENATFHQDVKDMKNKITNMQETMRVEKDDVLAKIDAIVNKRQQDDKRVLSHKEMHLPDKFAGDRVTFPEWTEEVMEQMDVRYKNATKIMKWAATQKEEIDIEDFENDPLKTMLENPAKFAEELFLLVRNYTKGEPKKLVKQVEESNGLEAWRLLHEEYDPHTDHSENMMWIKIANPKQVDKVDAVMSSIVEWEELVNRYTDITGNTVDDRTRRTAIIQICPEVLQEWLTLNSSNLKSYKEYRKKIMEYVNVKRVDMKVKNQANNVDTNVPRDEPDKEQDEVNQVGRHAPKGGKGYGNTGEKGAGQGKGGKVFNGSCWTCGGAHPQFLCPQFKAAQKAKGGLKGGPKGGMLYGPASGKGFGQHGGGKAGQKGFSKGFGSPGKGAMQVDTTWATDVYNAAMNNWTQSAPQFQSSGWQDYSGSVGFMGIVERVEKGTESGKCHMQEVDVKKLPTATSDKVFSQDSYFHALQEEDDHEWPSLVTPPPTHCEGSRPAKRSKPFTNKKKMALSKFLVNESKTLEGESTLCGCCRVSGKQKSGNVNTENASDSDFGNDGDNRNVEEQAQDDGVSMNCIEKVQPGMLNYWEAGTPCQSLNTVAKAGEWVEMVMDSGAGDHVAPKDWMPEYPRMDTDRSLGSSFTSATGEEMPNYGEKQVLMLTSSGTMNAMRVQTSNTKKFLGSVSRVMKAGNRVVFDEDGSYVVNKATGETTWMREERGIFKIDVWVVPPEKAENSQMAAAWQGFTRHGASP